MAGFEVFEGSDGQHYWRLKARNGEVVAVSEGYAGGAASAWEGVDAARRAVLVDQFAALTSAGRHAGVPAHLRPLGNRPPGDDRHIAKFPLRAVAAAELLSPEEVDKKLKRGYSMRLPYWHWGHDQGFEGSCVGHAVAMERAITNAAQNRLAVVPTRRVIRYNPLQIWNEAKKVDEWDDTNPGDDNGTSARAAYDVCRDIGPVPVKGMVLGVDGKPEPVKESAPDLSAGVVNVNRWATSVDEIRAAVASGRPVTIGTPWMSGFDRPVPRIGRFGRSVFMLPLPAMVGKLRGYHETCIYGADDGLGGFNLKNSWGRDFPLAVLPYETMEWCFTQDGTDAAVATDR